jgi:NAD(P)H-dependent flavin oxidoreductase YrpB (nitropropane dioxygenase family)
MDVPWLLPLMQAPIGPATTPALVIAVSRIGALGTLAASWTEPEVLREQIRQIKAATDGPFCVNLVLAFDQHDRLDAAIDERVPFVSFSWGLDEDMIARIHQSGAAALVQVGTVAEAVRAVAAGADVIIAQGTEAGGHVQSTTPLLRLLRDLRYDVRRPIVAAGGIAEPSAVRGALEAGADAVACGSAFLAAREADVHPHYLKRLIQAEADDTMLTQLFDVGWPNAPHRVLRNETVRRWENSGKLTPGARPGEDEVVAHRGGQPIIRYSDAQPTKSTSGDIEAMAMYAGHSVAGIKRSEPAVAIAERIVRDLT